MFQKVRGKITGISISECYFILLFLGIWMIENCILVPCADDIHLLNAVNSQGLWEVYSNTLKPGGWSSRFIIDFLLLTLLRFVPLWKVLNMFMVYILLKSFIKILGGTHRQEEVLAVMSVIMLYPFKDQSTAGWIATTVTYFWTSVCCLYVLSIFFGIIHNEKLVLKDYIFCIAAGIYAADDELGSVFLVVICGCVCVLMVTDKKIKKFPAAMEIFFAARLVFHLYWQGLGNRYMSEIHWFPEYGMLGSLDKIQIGFSTACYYLFVQHSIILLLLAAVLCADVFVLYIDVWHRGIALIPVIYISVQGIFNQAFLNVFPEINLLTSQYDQYGLVSNENYWKLTGYFSLFLWMAVCICIIVTITSICDTLKKAFVYICILAAGMASRIVMGFSPTVHASLTRTYIYLVFSILLCLSVFLFKLRRDNEKIGQIMFYICGVFGGVSFLETVCMSLGSR